MPKKKWFDDDGLWEAVMPILFDKTRIDNASKEVDDIITLTGVKPGTRVLDLCCGIGRHSIQFAGRGFDVTGVDITKGYLETARKSADERGVKAKFVHKDTLASKCHLLSLCKNSKLRSMVTNGCK